MSTIPARKMCKMGKIRSIFGLLIALLHYPVYSFDIFIQDSILSKSYSYIENKIFEEGNKQYNELYAKAYLRKAKIEENYELIADGYYLLSIITSRENSLKYLDSVIQISQVRKLKKYLGIAYQEKGKKYFNDGEFELSLDFYFKALKFIDKETQPNIFFIVTHNIGIIKDLIGQKSEALLLYQENLEHIKKGGIDDIEVDNYLTNLFSIAHSFTRNSKFDSASTYNRLGLNNSRKYNKPNHSAKFILGEGYNLFHKGDYETSLDTLKKAIPLIEGFDDNLNAAIGHLYVGKILVIKGSKDAVYYLKKADTLITGESRLYPDFVEIYELLTNFYKEKQESKNQLIYLEKLILYDRKLRDKYANLYSRITKEFDQPNLINEKLELIKDLEVENAKISQNIKILFVVIGILTFFSSYYYWRRLKYKRRFNKLLNEGLNPPKSITQSRARTDLPDEFVQRIFSKISDFEGTQRFLDNSISLTTLAKELGTNSNYLSRIINQYKGKNFSSYINELRIDYIVEELKKNKTLRQYTVKAIALEIGFKNPESFTNAFHKRVGIYPSYYIKELNKNQANSLDS